MSDPTAPLPPSGGGPLPPLPYSLPAGGPYGPRPGRSGAMIAAVLLSVLFVAGSIAVAVAANGDGGTGSSAVVSGPALPAGSGTSGAPSGGGDTAQPSATTSSPSTASVYPPPAPPTPTHVPLNSQAINRTFEVYMDALLYHNLASLKGATCPRLRHTETGTALHGKYLHRWKGLAYQIYDSLDYVRLSAKVYFDVGGTAVYDWYVERTPSGPYYVCGFLS